MDKASRLGTRLGTRLGPGTVLGMRPGMGLGTRLGTRLGATTKPSGQPICGMECVCKFGPSVWSVSVNSAPQYGVCL